MSNRSFLYTLQGATFRITLREDDNLVALATMGEEEQAFIISSGEFKGVMLSPIPRGIVVGLLTYVNGKYRAGVLIDRDGGKRDLTHWEFDLNTAGQRAHDENSLSLQYVRGVHAIMLEDVRFPDRRVISGSREVQERETETPAKESSHDNRSASTHS